MIDLSIEDITSNGTVVLDGTKYKWTGDGALDKLLEVVNANIKMQWDNGGITSKNFAEVYIGIIPTVLAQATQYAMQEKQIEADIAIKEKELEVKAAQLVLTERQVVNAEKDIETKAQQILNLQEDNLVKKQQVLSEKANVALIERNIFKVENEAKLVDEEVLNAQKQRDKLDADIEVEERTTVIAETQSAKDIESKKIQDGLVERNIVNAEKQIEKTEAEIKNINRRSI